MDSEGNTLDWMLSETRDQEAASKFFEKLFSNEHCCEPRVINVDKNAAYPPAFESCQSTGLIPKTTKLRRIKYLNNVIEQDHRFSKRRIVYGQWLQTVETAEATIAGYETMHMIRKGCDMKSHRFLLLQNDNNHKFCFVNLPRSSLKTLWCDIS